MNDLAIGYYILRRVHGYTRADGIQVKGYYRRIWTVHFPIPLKYLDLSYFGREETPPLVRLPAPPRPSKRRLAVKRRGRPPARPHPSRRKLKTALGGRGPVFIEPEEIEPKVVTPPTGRVEPEFLPPEEPVLEPIVEPGPPEGFGLMEWIPPEKGERDEFGVLLPKTKDEPILPPDTPQFSGGEWIPMHEWLSELEKVYDVTYEAGIEVQDHIYRQGKETDFIHAPSGLVFERPLERFSMAEIGATVIGVVRVWGLSYNATKDEYFIHARCKSIRESGPALSFNEAYEIAGELFEQLVRDLAPFDYVYVRQMVAWTFYYNTETMKEKAPGGRTA